MGLTMLRIDRSKVVWRHKLESAFDKKPLTGASEKDVKEGKGGKWTLFLLPLITVLREGLEAVVFVGGVSRLVFASFAQFADVASCRSRSDSLPRLFPSPPLLVSPAVLSAAVRPFLTYRRRRLTNRAPSSDLIYASSSRVNLSIFLVISTNVLLLLGAGLLSKSVGAFERYKFNKGFAYFLARNFPVRTD